MDVGAALDSVEIALRSGRDVTRAVSELWKVWIAGGGVLLAFVWGGLNRRVAVGALFALTLVAGLNYFRWGPRTLTEQVDTYDLIHYYLNARYFDELGYYDLYPACVLADHEADGPYFDEGSKYMAQDDAGHTLKPIAHALARGRVVKEERFTPERWAAFSHDFLYLQRQVPGMNDTLWRQLLQDHGFNGTVVWTLEAQLLSWVPVERVKWIGYADLLLLGVALGFVAWAFGGATALWGALFLFVTYSARWPTYSWAFFRYDYLAGLVIGMSLLRRGYPGWAGVFSAWAATLRLFPAMWLFGPATKGLLGLTRRTVHRPLLVLGGAFVIAALVLQGAAAARFGLEPVVTHFANMEDHNASGNLSSRRIGLALALPFTEDVGPTEAPKNIPKSTKQVVEEQKPLRFGLAAVVMGLLAWGLRKKSDEEGYAYGFLPFFLLTTASYYYYVARLTLIVLHASGAPRARHVVGLAWLFGLEVFSNWAETAWPSHRVFLIGWLAWGLFGYAVVQALWLVLEDYAEGRAEATGATPAIGAAARRGARKP